MENRILARRSLWFGSFDLAGVSATKRTAYQQRNRVRYALLTRVSFVGVGRRFVETALPPSSPPVLLSSPLSGLGQKSCDIPWPERTSYNDRLYEIGKLLRRHVYNGNINLITQPPSRSLLVGLTAETQLSR